MKTFIFLLCICSFYFCFQCDRSVAQFDPKSKKVLERLGIEQSDLDRLTGPFIKSFPGLVQQRIDDYYVEVRKKYIFETFLNEESRKRREQELIQESLWVESARSVLLSSFTKSTDLKSMELALEEVESFHTVYSIFVKNVLNSDMDLSVHFSGSLQEIIKLTPQASKLVSKPKYIGYNEFFCMLSELGLFYSVKDLLLSILDKTSKVQSAKELISISILLKNLNRFSGIRDFIEYKKNELDTEMMKLSNNVDNEMNKSLEALLMSLYASHLKERKKSGDQRAELLLMQLKSMSDENFLNQKYKDMILSDVYRAYLDEPSWRWLRSYFVFQGDAYFKQNKDFILQVLDKISGNLMIKPKSNWALNILVPLSEGMHRLDMDLRKKIYEKIIGLIANSKEVSGENYLELMSVAIKHSPEAILEPNRFSRYMDAYIELYESGNRSNLERYFSNVYSFLYKKIKSEKLSSRRRFPMTMPSTEEMIFIVKEAKSLMDEPLFRVEIKRFQKGIEKIPLPVSVWNKIFDQKTYIEKYRSAGGKKIVCTDLVKHDIASWDQEFNHLLNSP